MNALPSPGVGIKPMKTFLRTLLPPTLLSFATLAAGAEEAAFQQAAENAKPAAEAFERSRRFVDGWLARADKTTGLIPRNLRESNYWNGRDAAADNYSFMVMTAAMTDRALLEGRLLDMLRTETRLTSRIDRLPDDYSFATQGWRRETPDLDAMIFDGAEYVKDGLLTITEWSGKSPWSERMIGIVDDIWKNAAIDTPSGKIPTLNFEVNGDLLQAGARLYWLTGEERYLDQAIRLGDYFLRGKNHPTRDSRKLRLGDHSCEVINGLSELYVAVARTRPDKHAAYREPLHAMYDRILEVGVNTNGLFHTAIDPVSGEVLDATPTDNWGYNLDGMYAVWLVDGAERYRDATRRALGSLQEHYTGQLWERGSADGLADSIEGALNLFNREPVPSAAEWMDTEIRRMWAKQQPDGVIEGWHGDGNFARTSLMYALWKTQGCRAEPWRKDVRVGAVREGRDLCVSLSADAAWSGRLVFDRPRHRDSMRLPLDYPRINQFPEWFTLPAGILPEGVPVELTPGVEVRLVVSPDGGIRRGSTKPE